MAENFNTIKDKVRRAFEEAKEQERHASALALIRETPNDTIHVSKFKDGYVRKDYVIQEDEYLYLPFSYSIENIPFSAYSSVMPKMFFRCNAIGSAPKALGITDIAQLNYYVYLDVVYGVVYINNTKYNGLLLNIIIPSYYKNIYHGEF